MHTELMTRVVLVLALAGCAHNPFRAPLTCPARGGPPWTELESPHFRMRTDLGVNEARRVLGEFEVIYGMLEDLSDFAFPPRQPPEGRIHLIIFERARDYQEIGMRNTEGMYTLRMHEVEPIPTIIVTGDLSSRTRRILQHELVHRFMRHHVPGAPLWLHEGMAEYLSTTKLEGKLAILGDPIPDWRVATFVGLGEGTLEGVPVLLAADFPSVRELMTAAARPSDAKKNRLFYAGSWELVHLLNGSREYQSAFKPSSP